MATENDSTVNALYKIFLRVNENLADLEDVDTAKKNLGLGDLATKDSLTASDVGAYPITGGTLNGPVVANTTDPGLQKVAAAWNTDASANIIFRAQGADTAYTVTSDLYLNNGNYWAYRIYTNGNDNVKVWEFRTNGDFHSPGRVYMEDAYISTDGNIYGSVWDGHLNNWVVSQIRESASSGSGWVKDERTGMISQAGRISASSGNMHVTFPVAFSSEVLAIVLTVGTTNNINATYYNDNTSGFDVSLNGGVEHYSLSWFALGK
ncbi:hypothetical protein EH228_10340 [Erwinia endophytica]|uniref:gp53-like domain-containing protein n=1 Tax=Erwinia endophytica TaxID=1563158 RepID=UPI001265E95C|nr:hypothetical protein [Erwinia endophytica]KAB8310506.1 hypothetical protein EH228_10340 [Erwinia endophytica]